MNKPAQTNIGPRLKLIDNPAQINMTLPIQNSLVLFYF